MNGYNGFSNLNSNLNYSNNFFTIEKMTKTLTSNFNSKTLFFTDENINIGEKIIVSNNLNNKEKIYTYSINNNTYTILFIGNIYNIKDIQKDLLNLGYYFKTKDTTEIILKAFLHYGCAIFKKFNGAFSFVIYNKSKYELLLCRDHFGFKPLYYAVKNDTIIFSTEIKSILQHPFIEACIDNNGIGELFGIGPAHTPGNTVFKDIFELKPAHYAIFNSYGLKLYKYWEMETQSHTDSFNKTCDTVKFLLEDSIKNQINTDIPIYSMLSGGIDSSIIVAFISNFYKENNLPTLNTISIDYLDNDKNFVKSDFQPNGDNYFINVMKNKFKTNHHSIILDTPELAKSLEDAMIARDCPGMADVDSSMLLFAKEIKKFTPIALSGECSDEIFAGYPWFFREDALQSETFPWSIALNERQNLLNSKIKNKINLKDYIDNKYHNTLKEIEFDENDSTETKQKRIISYLTLNWFMQTLIDRADKMCSYNDLEVRVPFCDYRLVQYMWNVPWEIKAYQGREKGLLRYIVKDLLPLEIVERKKSPFPKTHNPSYLNTVKEMLSNIINNPNAPICNLLDKAVITEILNTDGKSFSRPWFGQLMTGPQLMAYLCQVNMWLEKYNPKICL